MTLSLEVAPDNTYTVRAREGGGGSYLNYREDSDSFAILLILHTRTDLYLKRIRVERVRDVCIVLPGLHGILGEYAAL